MFSCSGCKVNNTDGAKCSKCSANYCFSCLSITEKNFKKLGAQRQGNMMCATCKLGTQATSPVPQARSSATLDMVLQELRDGIASINKRLEPLPALISEVREIKDRMNHCEDALSNFDKEVADVQSKTALIESKINNLEISCAEFKTYPQLNMQLSSDLNSRDQKERLNNVEIKGVPQKKNENLISIVTKLGEFIGQSIALTDINFVTRARSNSSVKPIIIGFTRRIVKDNFVASSKSHKRLNTEDLGFQGATNRIFINDHLTRDNKQLLTRTKKLALEKNYQFTWVQNCKILVRKNDTSPIIHILGDKDLSKLN